MKQLFFLMILGFILTASNCNKEDEDCHYTVKVKNNSAKQIVWGISTGIDSCRIDGQFIKSNETFEYRPFNTCIENSLTSSSTLKTMYIIDPSNYNPDNRVSCDSIEYKNTILKKYELTLKQLKAMGFVVSYP